MNTIEIQSKYCQYCTEVQRIARAYHLCVCIFISLLKAIKKGLSNKIPTKNDEKSHRSMTNKRQNESNSIQFKAEIMRKWTKVRLRIMYFLLYSHKLYLLPSCTSKMAHECTRNLLKFYSHSERVWCKNTPLRDLNQCCLIYGIDAQKHT